MSEKTLSVVFKFVLYVSLCIATVASVNIGHVGGAADIADGVSGWSYFGYAASAFSGLVMFLALISYCCQKKNKPNTLVHPESQSEEDATTKPEDTSETVKENDTTSDEDSPSPDQ